MLVHVPCVQESLVHFTPSSQSLAVQHVPQVADAPSALAQHCCPSAQNGVCSQALPVHESLVHGSLSSHCEVSQHSAQPTPAQHNVFLGSSHLRAVWSQSSVSVTQLSSVQASPSSQPSSSAHTSLRRQSAEEEQYSSSAQLPLFGE